MNYCRPRINTKRLNDTSPGMFFNHLTPCYHTDDHLHIVPPHCCCSHVVPAVHFFCLASHKAMRTPSSSAQLLKSKLFQSPAQRICSPRGRRVSKFDINNLLSKSPRSSNLRSKYDHTANGFSVKRLLELTSRTRELVHLL